MAKDGTNRGGARIGAGAKKKALAEKIAEGNPGGRPLTVMEFQNTADLKGEEMPEPN
ncbi:MAG: terminase, partial [Clostridium sp.]|nr:terminase [Clostridium sp.]